MDDETLLRRMLRDVRYRLDKLHMLHAQLVRFVEFASEVLREDSQDADGDALRDDRDRVLETLSQHVNHCRALEAVLREWGSPKDE
jgi:hypothetical protein